MVLYITLRLFFSFVEEIASPSQRVERRWLELVSKGDLVTTLAAGFCNFWSLSLK